MSADELETMRLRAESAEARIASVSGVTRERLAEEAYRRGFDAGVKHQREAAPPPKARDLKRQLFATAALLRDLREQMLNHYDGAPDSSTRWMGHALARIDEALK